MQSPIRVSHQLITEVFFSVVGEDDFGRPIPPEQQPGLRIFRLTKAIVVPSCAMIPMWLQPPSCTWSLHPCTYCTSHVYIRGVQTTANEPLLTYR